MTGSPVTTRLEILPSPQPGGSGAPPGGPPGTMPEGPPFQSALESESARTATAEGHSESANPRVTESSREADSERRRRERSHAIPAHSAPSAGVQISQTAPDKAGLRETADTNQSTSATAGNATDASGSTPSASGATPAATAGVDRQAGSPSTSVASNPGGASAAGNPDGASDSGDAGIGGGSANDIPLNASNAAAAVASGSASEPDVSALSESQRGDLTSDTNSTTVSATSVNGVTGEATAAGQATTKGAAVAESVQSAATSAANAHTASPSQMLRVNPAIASTSSTKADSQTAPTSSPATPEPSSTSPSPSSKTDAPTPAVEPANSGDGTLGSEIHTGTSASNQRIFAPAAAAQGATAMHLDKGSHLGGNGENSSAQQGQRFGVGKLSLASHSTTAEPHDKLWVPESSETTGTTASTAPADAATAVYDVGASDAAYAGDSAYAADLGTLDLGAGMGQAIESLQATIELAARQGISQARIALHPQELGAIRIHLTQTSDGLVARVTAETPAAAQALAAGHTELRNSLGTIGLNLARLHIGLGSDGQSAPGGQGPATGNREAGARAPLTTATRRVGRTSGPSTADDPEASIGQEAPELATTSRRALLDVLV